MLAAIASEMADLCGHGRRTHAGGVSKTVLSLTGDRGFESVSLHRRV
jgi:hypothetical protein